MISTILDVALLAGVSRMTVSRYINGNGYTSEAVRQRIKEAIIKLNFRPNRIAQSLTTGLTKNIALILSDISNPLYTLIIKGVEKFAFEKGYNLIICNTDYSAAREKEYVHTLVDKLVDGIIVAPSCMGIEHFQEAQERGIPLVFIARKVEGITADYVAFDDVDGSYELVQHLIELGHTRIGVICRDVDMLNGRILGYKQAMAQAGIAYAPQLITSCTVVDEEKGYECAEKLLSAQQPPTAIFATVNILAGGTLLYCRKHQIQVPQQLAITSFDSFAEVDCLIHPQLTCNIIPAFALGQKAAEILLQRVRSNADHSSFTEITLKGQLLIRESTIG